VNRGSATPLQVSDASGVTQVVGSPTYGKNVLGYIGSVITPEGNVISTTIPYYLINDTNLSVLTPAVDKYRTISYWARFPNTKSGLISLPALEQQQSLPTSLNHGLTMSAYIPTVGSTIGYLRILDRGPAPSQNIFVDTTNTFTTNAWRHFVIVHTYGTSNTNYIYVNGTLLYQWQALAVPPDYTLGGYGFGGEFGSGWAGNEYPDTRWNDLRVEQRYYTQAQAATLFNSRRAYYGV
jgi:hypothetical protein